MRDDILVNLNKNFLNKTQKCTNHKIINGLHHVDSNDS